MSREEENMATKRAEPKGKAKAVPAEATTTPDKRRSFGNRGWLAVEVDKVLRKTPDATVPVGEIVKQVKNSAGEHPSTGAVAACIRRWGDQGYCKVKTNRPLSFNGYMAKWKSSDLDSFLESQKKARAKTRAAKANA
jgi:hypothetical protein